LPINTIPATAPRQNSSPHFCHVMFDMHLPQGRCIGLQIPSHHENTLNHLNSVATFIASWTRKKQLRPRQWIQQYLHPKEISHGLRECRAIATQETFFLGRLALRYALWTVSSNINEHINKQDMNTFWHYSCFPWNQSKSIRSSLSESHTMPHLHCILKDSLGRPCMPPGWVGSISHKKNTAVALVAANENAMAQTHDVTEKSTTRRLLPSYGVGVDIENIDPKRSRIAARVLTPAEILQLGRIKVGMMIYFFAETFCRWSGAFCSIIIDPRDFCVFANLY
jgi:hypothetical protein